MKISNTHRTLFSAKAIGLCTLAIILALFGGSLPAAFAVTSAEKYAEVDEILARIDVLQTDLNQAEEDYDVAVDDYNTATDAMNEAQERVEAAEDRIADLQERLAGRASDMYKGGNTTFMDVLLGASSFEEFLTSWDMIEKISSQDAELVQETKDTRAEAEAAREEFEKQQKIADEKVKEAEDLMTQIEATQASLKEEAESISQEAAELEAQEIAAAEEEARLAEEAAKAAAAASNNDYSQPGLMAPTGSGILNNPLPGYRITSSWGMRFHPILHYNRLHSGTDFGAPAGTPYYAAGSGTVSMVGSGGEAGNMIVISHGNGITTRYYHSTEVFVSVGQQVQAGQTIGTVGSTGNSTGPHLHFEVNVNGTSVDPMLYI